MRTNLIYVTAVLIGCISGFLVAKLFFTPSIVTQTPTLPDLVQPHSTYGSSTLLVPPQAPTSLLAANSQATIPSFDSPVIFSIGEIKQFPDGLKVTFTSMNDSRCQPEVECMWASALTPTLTLTGGSFGKSDVVAALGSDRSPTLIQGAYTVSLTEAALSTISLTVKKINVPTAVSKRIQPAKQVAETSVQRKPAPTAPVETTLNFANEVTRLITQATAKFRSEQSLPSLKADSTLAASAEKYSAKLLAGGYLAHVDKNGCDLTCRFDESGYSASSWGENLAMMEYDERPSAAYVANFFMSEWKKSSGHRKNLLSDTFSHQGIGVSVAEGKVYVVVHFALPQ